MSPSDESELRRLCVIDIQFREASCVGKVLYANRSLALLSVRPWKRSFVNPYRCRFCNGWHVGTEWRSDQKKRMANRQRAVDEERL